MPPQTPAIGQDVTALMGGSRVPAVGEDVSHLMDAPNFRAENEKDTNGNAVVVNGKSIDLSGLPEDIQVQLRRIASGESKHDPDMILGNIRGAVNSWIQHGPHAVVEGLRDVWRGNYARGARQVLSGGALTAAPMLAPEAAVALSTAPITSALTLSGGAIGGGAAGAVAQRGASALGATPDQAGLVGDVAAMGGGAGGATLAKRGAEAGARLIGDVLPEKLYAQIFKYADDDLRRTYQSVARGAAPKPSLAREALERGIGGSSEDMAVYSVQRLDELERELQDKAGRRILVMPEKSKYVDLLDDIEQRYRSGFFSDRAEEAAHLKASLQGLPGPAAKATDMLATRRFLDGLRNTSSFRLDPNLAPKQEELKVAADKIRVKLRTQPALASLINEQRVHINALDAVIDDAVKRQNAKLFGLIDSVLSASGPKGVAVAAAQRGAQTPRVITGIAQALYRGAPAAGLSRGAVRAAGAVAGTGGRAYDADEEPPPVP